MHVHRMRDDSIAPLHVKRLIYDQLADHLRFWRVAETGEDVVVSKMLGMGITGYELGTGRT